MTDDYTKRSLYKNLPGRRAFLRATLVSVAGAVVACKGGDGTSDDGSTSGGTSGDEPTGTSLPTTSGEASTGATTGAEEELLDGAAYFPQSVVSGDPRPDTVIVWTRLEDPDLGDADGEVEISVATDPEFTAKVPLDVTTVPADETYDRCVKVKLRGLEPATTYYYRFIYTRDDGRYVSPVGRTRTAPAPGDDVPVKFAFVSCQDFNGRYYNGYAYMAAMELDFIVHLGDYVYETTGDPKFQQTTGRAVTFTDKAGAIVFNEGTDTEYFAAKSLSNYRELYRTYRSDPALRRIHELFPMICTWDDHEYSDDCHQDVATYYGGRVDEKDPDRRKAANQAWFEYMPVDFREEDFKYDPKAEVPGDIEIYRDFTFGKHLHLVMTDLRSHRTDHLIPEDGFPGAVVLDQAALEAALDQLPDEAAPYVDIDSYDGGSYKDALVAAAPDLDYDPAKVTGNIDVGYINDTLEKIASPLAPIMDDGSLERGFAFRHLGKLSPHASIGARYLVVRDTFQLWASLNYEQSGGATQDAMGPEQEQWFLDTMQSAGETWKVWGNEYCLVPLGIDLTALPLPPAFAQRFLMNVDQWDGMRDRRSKLLDELAKLSNVVAITGDIHAFYAGTPPVNDDPTKYIFEFVTSGMSSGTFKTQLVLQVAADPVLSMTPGADSLAAGIDDLFKATGVNPHLAHADSGRNGFATVELDGTQLLTTFHAINEVDVDVDLEDDPDLASKFFVSRFKVEAGKRDLYKEINGEWKRWDPVMGVYV